MHDPKQHFRDLLEIAHWTQAEAARQLHMTPAAVNQIYRENCTVKPSASTLRFLEVLVELKQSGKLVIAPKAEPPLPKGIDAGEVELLSQLRQLPARARTQLTRAIIALIKAS